MGNDNNLLQIKGAIMKDDNSIGESSASVIIGIETQFLFKN